MILVYTGTGKGKTCACVGQILRCLGHRRPCAFGQFLKRDETSGEQRILKQLLGERFCAHGLGFLSRAERTEHLRHCQELLCWAYTQIPHVHMLVLDEFLYAVHYGFFSDEDVTDLLDTVRDFSCHLVLSGRYATGMILERADLVTVLDSARHPHAAGIPAQIGIEY